MPLCTRVFCLIAVNLAYAGFPTQSPIHTTGTFPPELHIHWSAIFYCDGWENCSGSAGSKTEFVYRLFALNPAEFLLIFGSKKKKWGGGVIEVLAVSFPYKQQALWLIVVDAFPMHNVPSFSFALITSP